MKIFGVAILAACFLLGQILGEFLGSLLGVSGNVGGVGFAMLLLIFLTDWMKRKNFLTELSLGGILFWSAMYIPVVVAMSATQHVKAALRGGWVALIAGVWVTMICFLLIPVLSRFVGSGDADAHKQKEAGHE